jgi:hypothetical protein
MIISIARIYIPIKTFFVVEWTTVFFSSRPNSVCHFLFDGGCEFNFWNVLYTAQNTQNNRVYSHKNSIVMCPGFRDEK